MPEPTPNAPERAKLRRRVQQLRAAVYAQTDPTTDTELVAELARAETQLREAVAPASAATAAPAPPAPVGRMLGPETTGLKVEPVVTMNPIPTAIYPLLDPETDPLTSSL